MKDIKVSVIVPVYKTEKYLQKCLESLVAQTLKEIEIIVVNDGSPDGSQKIIDRFAQEYPQYIVPLCKENGGLADARNAGLAVAKGEYVGFVDSDDWVEPEMYDTMYAQASRTRCDVVLCDFIAIFDGWEHGDISAGYRGPNPEGSIRKKDFIRHSLNPATACNRIYSKKLFQIAQFPNQWYEDMATTPILMSYANKIGYVAKSFYYYRKVEQSITNTIGDARNLQVIDSWANCLHKVNPEFLTEMEAAVYQSIITFMHFKPECAHQYLEYAKQNSDRFAQNPIIQKEIREQTVGDLFAKQLIPKKLHYFWFGGQPKSELIKRCIASWKKYAADFEIIEWNENNCDLHANRYVEQAYEAKKWAFVADYFRMEKVTEYGGIYLDTDVELTRDPSLLCLNSAFFAFETREDVNACIFGAVAHHPVVEECCESYKDPNFCFKNKDGSYNTSYTIVRRITRQLKPLGLLLNGREQLLEKDVHIYPPNKLTVDVFDGENIAQHHYDCSWWDVKTGQKSYKNKVLCDYFANNQVSSGEYEELLRQRDFYKQECERLQNTTCWKITKPVRAIGDLRKKLK